MRVKDLFESEETLEFQDNTGRLQLNIDAPLRFLYRSVSREELDQIERTGKIQPSQFYGRIHASAIPVGGDTGAYRVLKIKFNPNDGWKSKVASKGVYAITWEDIPADRIVDVIPMSIISSNALLKKTKMSQYMEYQ